MHKWIIDLFICVFIEVSSKYDQLTYQKLDGLDHLSSFISRIKICPPIKLQESLYPIFLSFYGVHIYVMYCSKLSKHKSDTMKIDWT